MRSNPPSEGNDAVLLSFPRRVTAPVAVALAATAIAAAASPMQAGQVRAQEWWLQALHITKAWATTEGPGITVALLDTGVNPATPDLRGPVTAGPDLTGSGRHSGGPYWGIHGTAMASLIVGHGHGSHGGAGIAGVAPQARILSIRVVMETSDPLQANPAIAGRQAAAIAAGIRYAADHDVQVIDLPLDPTRTAAAGGSPAEQAAVAYALAKGVTLVAPAGDDGAGTDLVNYPAAYPGVISVGAFDRNIVKARFSNRHPYVTLTSAGAGVVAATPSGGYALFNSTGAASAVVAGMAALIKSRYPALTPAEVTQALTRSTVFHPAGGRARGSGYGTTDAARALVFAAAIQAAAPGLMPGTPHTPAVAVRPASTPAVASVSSSMLTDAAVLFVLFLIALLLLSIIAVVRAPGTLPAPPDEDAGETTDVLPQFMPSRPALAAGQLRPAYPGQPPPGQRSYADAASRLSPARPGAPAHAPGGAARGGSGYPARQAPGLVPWEGTIRPPSVPGGPPWGPAPKPDGEPPPPSRPPRRV